MAHYCGRTHHLLLTSEPQIRSSVKWCVHVYVSPFFASYSHVDQEEAFPSNLHVEHV